MLPASAPIAEELAKRLPTVAPTLHAWLRTADARVSPFDPHEAGCTPFEGWQLREAGFQPVPGQQLGAGLGPLLAGRSSASPEEENGNAEKIWIADLAHVALGTDRASLLPAESLALTVQEGADLYDAVRPLLEDSDFAAQPLNPYRWRLRLPDGMAPRTASPSVVIGQPLSEWWVQDVDTRPWRRLMNEIQMVWYQHPVNEDRVARGLLPVNTLWLYGGAMSWPPAKAGSSRIVEDMHACFMAEDWAGWLDAIQHTDANVLKTLSDEQGLPVQPIELLLLGRDRSAALALKPRSRLLRWLPSSTKNWSAWWSPRA